MGILKSRLFKIIAIIVSIPVVLFGVYLLIMIITDYKPDKAIKLEIDNNQKSVIKKDESISIITFNIGYGGMDKDQDFFMDGGLGSRSKSKEKTLENITKISAFLKSKNTDFIMLQEVDRKSTRSFKVNEVEFMKDALKDYASSFALNYKVFWVPIPISKPHGSVQAGLLTMSKYGVESSTRYSLPGTEAFLRQLGDLDRCVQENRIPVEDGKELVLVNAHLSAYDKGGVIRKQQLQFLKEFVQKEFEKGNYVVVGGDWNHSMPGTDPSIFKTKQAFPDWLKTIPEDFAPKRYKWVIDKTVPSNRTVDIPFKKDVNFLSVIDGFLVSPNVDVISTKGINLEFENTDHNPVLTELKLK
ncbi:endonuclease/exonuclease/phosphatase family metal-dependent hydrolase [Clostridium punense]|uniref:Endonuclease/exonuclease/phosphatase family metal-dependent hydrolase n=2 Tax=Clostridium TaxID=1485 RepID=A0ABS4K5X6_9CLOT|nr:endonuclease/exonuclease/phosphatase family protein [Clostridium punense]MBP2023182.1 endonuclease/exonuclease/phosphatase family metal-dependent hydrolase [Clostridium punense]